MITIRKVHPSGMIEVSAIVRNLKTHQVWLEWQGYLGCTNDEARKLFRTYLAEHGFGLVND